VPGEGANVNGGGAVSEGAAAVSADSANRSGGPLFMVCLALLYWMSRDPFFLVVLAVVALGVALTLMSYFADRATRVIAQPSPPRRMVRAPA